MTHVTRKKIRNNSLIILIIFSNNSKNRFIGYSSTDNFKTNDDISR